MSYYRPDSANSLTITTAKAVGMVGTIISAAMLTGIAVGTWPAALLLGATSIATWKSANIGSKARDYNIKRQNAFELADKNSTTPTLPPNPFLDPLKQPSTVTTGFARIGAATSLIAATLFLFSPAAPLATSALLYVVGGTGLRMTNIAEKARHYAEQEQAVHQKRTIEAAQSPETPEPEINSPSQSYENTPQPKVVGKYTAALMNERKEIRLQQNEL